MMMRMFTDLYDLEDAYFAGRVDLKTYLKEFCRLTAMVAFSLGALYAMIVATVLIKEGDYDE